MITAINQLFKWSIERQDIIESVHLFDTLINAKYVVQGAELRLINNCPDFAIAPDEYDQLHFDPFKLHIKGYAYLVLGSEKDFINWVKEKFDSLVVDKVCRKFDFFRVVCDQKEVEEYRKEAFRQTVHEYAMAYHIMSEYKAKQIEQLFNK